MGISPYRQKKRTMALTALTRFFVPFFFTRFRYASQGCRLYSKALSLGPKYLYQIMPRLLTHWLDLGRRVHVSQANPGVSSSELGEFRRINELMNALADHLPEYMVKSDWSSLPGSTLRFSFLETGTNASHAICISSSSLLSLKSSPGYVTRIPMHSLLCSAS